MSYLEQQMIEALDGKFYSFTLDGNVIDSREAGRIYRRRSSSSRYKYKGHRQWTDNDTAYVRANLKTKSIPEIAEYLGVPYHRAYAKVQSLFWLEFKEEPNGQN